MGRTVKIRRPDLYPILHLQRPCKQQPLPHWYTETIPSTGYGSEPGEIRMRVCLTCSGHVASFHVLEGLFLDGTDEVIACLPLASHSALARHN